VPVKSLAVLLLATVGWQAWGLDYDIQKVTNASGHTLNVVHMFGVMDTKEVFRWTGETSELDPGLDTLFVLNSPGGNVPIGIFTIKKIDEFIAQETQNNRKTWIAIDGECASMCLPFFYAWPNRFAVADAKFGLHSPSDGYFGADADLSKLYLDNMRVHGEARGETSALAWLNQMVSKGEFATSTVTFHSAQDIANAGGIVPAGGIVSSVDQLIQQL
jgi:ATP-dependent protease ClpP protease subunit